MIDFMPEDVVLHGMPLVDTLGHAEREQAAACLILALATKGYGWLPVHASDLLWALERTTLSWQHNPAFRPDFSELIEHGQAIDLAPGWIELTALAIEKLRPYVLDP